MAESVPRKGIVGLMEGGRRIAALCIEREGNDVRERERQGLLGVRSTKDIGRGRELKLRSEVPAREDA